MHATIYTTRTISAGHFLPNYYGPCSSYHGHNFKVEVWINGPIDSDTGMVMDFKSIKNIIDVYDHGDLNDHMFNPTAENLATEIYQNITIARGDTCHVRVRVWESENSYAEVQG